jgi:hypothetical protein
MCPNKLCACRISEAQSLEEFMTLWEENFTLTEEAQIYRELGITDVSRKNLDGQ